MSDRYSRNEGLFGAEGQAAIARTRVAVVGAGGLGCHVAQQLSYLGTKYLAVIDDDIVTLSSLNRLVGATEADAIAGTKKVVVAQRTARAANATIEFDYYDGRVEDSGAYELLEGSDVIFGCVDDDAARLSLTRISAELKKPYIDLASDIGASWWGGHVLVADGEHCLVCLGMLALEQLAVEGMTPDQRLARDRIYGIPRAALATTGPMVVSINASIASFGITEFVALVTGIREPFKNLTYRADLQMLTKSKDAPSPNCYYCKGLRASGRRD
ncbi:MAG: ThiF family adenylyltransferase [Actinomycetota bacterium]|nr:ThiF family adenylyltransferase [Actinomycetota bacterium]